MSFHPQDGQFNRLGSGVLDHPTWTARKNTVDLATQRRDQLHKVAVESIAAQMMNNSRDIRMNGADRIMDALQRQDESSLVAQIAAHLRERPDQQERDAVAVLTRHTGISRIEHLDTICDKLWDSESPIRRAALKALAQVAPPGDSVSVETLVAHSEDDDPHVRKAVVDGLMAVASPGDPIALDTVLIRLEDVNGFVREASAQALERLGVVPDQEVLVALLEALAERVNQDADWAVRDAASQTHRTLQQHAQTVQTKRGSKVSFGGGGSASGVAS
jgi:HEAT repeat protein